MLRATIPRSSRLVSSRTAPNSVLSDAATFLTRIRTLSTKNNQQLTFVNRQVSGFLSSRRNEFISLSCSARGLSSTPVPSQFYVSDEEHQHFDGRQRNERKCEEEEDVSIVRTPMNSSRAFSRVTDDSIEPFHDDKAEEEEVTTVLDITFSVAPPYPVNQSVNWRGYGHDKEYSIVLRRK